MKRIITILVLCLFLMSVVPFVAADDANGGEGDDLTVSPSDGADSDSAKQQVDRAYVKQKRDELKEKAREIRQDFREAKLISIQAREKIQENFKLAKESFDEQKKALVEARKQLKDCSAAGNCEEVKKEYRKKAKPYLEHTADVILKLLEKLKNRISESSLEDKDELISAVDAKIAEVQAVKDKVSAMSEEPTKEEIQAIAQELKAKWTETKRTVKVSAGKVVLDRYAGILVKIEQLEKKLDRVVAKMKEKGLDTGAVEPKIAEFKGHIADARADFEEAKKLFGSADTLDAAKAKAKESKEHLKKAYQVLKDIVAGVKKANGAVILAEEASASSE